jgi:23S rRNA (uracil-5-)-methyltransferase RumA
VRKKQNIILENVLVEDYAAEGKSIARVDGKVVFIEKAVPGDVVDIRLTKNKKEWSEGYAVQFHSFSADRVIPFCSHFGVCGGCQWQMLPYEKQLYFKQRQVEEALKRIGKISLPEISPILGADETRYYRNKLEYTFSTKEFSPLPPSPSPTPVRTGTGGLPKGKGQAPSNSPNGGEPHTAQHDEDEFYYEADPMLYKTLKEFVSLNRKNPTNAESFLWEQLRGKKLGKYKFRRQHIVGGYIADFVCLAKKLIIEVDGLAHQLPENLNSDEERTFWLETKGYTVLRFNNAIVLNNPEKVLSVIQHTLDKLAYAERKNYSSKASPVGGGLVGASFGEDLGEASGASGFHAKGFFDKVVEIEKCWLQDEPTNAIRNTIAAFARGNNYSFYDFKMHRGFLRNVQTRICTTGEVMVNIVFGPDTNEDDQEEKRKRLFDHLLQKVPGITTLLYTINTKFNDSLHDLQPVNYHGKGYIIEKLSSGIAGEDFQFKVGPKSFFQTNSRQAAKLYAVAREFAELKGDETIYDLYCGTGSIGIFLSKKAKKIIGVDLMQVAIEDARENAALNNISHAEFFGGDVIKICNDDFFSVHGKPDVIISDPPRAGMHEKLVNKILDTAAPIVVYVSCNPATQARDLGLLDEKYRVMKVQPVDMFPHTHHIENVVQLKLKS